MPWLLLDLLLVLLGVALLGLAGLRLYRAGRRLLRTVGDAGDRVADASAGLSAAPPDRGARTAV